MSRILVLSPIPPPPDGIGSHSEHLIEAWSAAGHEVLALSTGVDAGLEQRTSFRVRRVLGMRSRTTAVAEMRTFQPDLVFCQFAVSALTVGTETALSVCRAAKKNGISVAMGFHEPLREVSMLGPLGRPIYRRAAKACTVAITFSSSGTEALDFARPLVPIVQVPHGIPAIAAPTSEDGQRVRNAYGLAGPFVLDVGYIHPDKGVDVLVAAVSHLMAARSGELDIVIAGRPRRRSLLFTPFGLIDERHYASTRQMALTAPASAHFSFPDYLPNEDLWPLLAEASVVVLPYRRTTQSGVAAAVLAASGASVVTQLPGLAGAFGDAAVYATPDDPADLARAINLVLSDPGLQARLRRNARRRAESEGYDVVAEKILAVGRTTG